MLLVTFKAYLVCLNQKMKPIITVLCILFCTHNAFSQSTLNFCASVDQYGNCALNNSKFFLSQDSAAARIFVEIKDTNTFLTVAKITFKFYSVKNGAETFEGFMVQEVQSTWMYAWVPHLFKAAGKYVVKAFNEKDELMCSRSLEMVEAK